MNKELFILIGIPGSGKSYWAKHQFHQDLNKTKYISRDEIRFALLNDDDNYFDKEKEAYKQFIDTINLALVDDDIEYIIIDATHLTKGSRKKLFNNILVNDDVTITYVIFETPFNICWKRNKKRKGRAKVPKGVMKNMSNSLNYSDLMNERRIMIYDNDLYALFNGIDFVPKIGYYSQDRGERLR